MSEVCEHQWYILKKSDKTISPKHYEVKCNKCGIFDWKTEAQLRESYDVRNKITAYVTKYFYDDGILKIDAYKISDDMIVDCEYSLGTFSMKSKEWFSSHNDAVKYVISKLDDKIYKMEDQLNTYKNLKRKFQEEC
jgi:hypothetical protein